MAHFRTILLETLYQCKGANVLFVFSSEQIIAARGQKHPGLAFLDRSPGDGVIRTFRWRHRLPVLPRPARPASLQQLHFIAFAHAGMRHSAPALFPGAGLWHLPGDGGDGRFPSEFWQKAFVPGLFGINLQKPVGFLTQVYFHDPVMLMELSAVRPPVHFAPRPELRCKWPASPGFHIVSR